MDLINTFRQAPTTGRRSIDICGNQPGGISRTIAAVSGQEYLVSFYLAGNPDNNANDTLKRAVVSVGVAGQNVAFDTAGLTKANTGWSIQGFVFTAIANASTLFFVGFSLNGAYAAAIGGVVVAETAVRASILLIGICLLLLLGYPDSRVTRLADPEGTAQ